MSDARRAEDDDLADVDAADLVEAVKQLPPIGLAGWVAFNGRECGPMTPPNDTIFAREFTNPTDAAETILALHPVLTSTWRILNDAAVVSFQHASGRLAHRYVIMKRRRPAYQFEGIPSGDIFIYAYQAWAE
jgi:hypothetical protein